MAEVKYRVLIVDDAPEDRELYRSLLCSREECEFEFVDADTGAEGLAIALAEEFDCILIDYAMPDSTGLEVIERYLHARSRPSPIVMVTGRGDEKVAVRALKLGASDYIVKSELTSDAIYRAVHNAIDKARLVNALEIANGRLHEEKERAERASVAKSTFLANMSHEIRTPLSAILGFSELITRGNLQPEQLHRFAQAIFKNGETLMQILNDVLDLSKIEAGKLSVEAAPVEVHQILQDVLNMFEGTASRKRLEVTSRIAADLPKVLALDPTRLRQILFNLLSNALKFTERGRIHLGADYADGHLVVAIEDTGIGVSAEQMPRLFEAFQQGDESTTRRFGGTGLGLLLSRRLAEAMGGTVELVRTNANEGSVFALRVPAVVVDAVRAAEERPVRLGPLRVLVVEDSDDARTFVCHVLTEAGARVDAAEDGARGLVMASAGKYDVIVSDLRMPGLDGLELARRLRASGFGGLLLGLSAHAFPEDRSTALRCGFDEFLAKPVNSTVLCRHIAERIGSASEVRV